MIWYKLSLFINDKLDSWVYSTSYAQLAMHKKKIEMTIKNAKVIIEEDKE